MNRAKHFSRDEIDLDSLRKLQDLFGNDGELDEQGFVDAFGSILGDNLSDQQLTHLFMKIDANSDGSVDWDEFTNYMFLDNQDTENTTAVKDDEPSTQYKSSLIDFFELSNQMRHCHKSQVVALLHLDKHNMLLSAGRDGVVRLWSTTSLAHQVTILVRKANRGSMHENAAVNDWVTSVSYMSRSSKVAVGSVDRGVCIYDLNTETHKMSGNIPTKRLMVPRTSTMGHKKSIFYTSEQLKKLCDKDRTKPAAPISLDYFYDAVKKREMLFVGDDTGGVHVFYLEERMWQFQEHHTQGATSILCVGHTDHVMKVEFIPDLGCLVTASLDSNINVIDLERRRLKRHFTQHKKAVYSFVWCKHAKVIASCGLERMILLWSPYSRHSIAQLQGHSSSIRSLIVNDDYKQLISLSTGGVIKVWDVRNLRCVQTIGNEDQVSSGARAIGAVQYVAKHRYLVGATNKLVIWQPAQQFQVQDSSHNHPVTAALYNASFHQVVSADQNADLSIWNVETGHIISKFRLHHGDQKNKAAVATSAVASIPRRRVITRDQNSGVEGIDDADAGQGAITAMCFDDGGRRLITGSHDGSDVKIWNFSNGCLLRTLVKKSNAELTRGSRRPGKKSLSRPLSDRAFQKKHDKLAKKLGLENKVKFTFGPSRPAESTRVKRQEKSARQRAPVRRLRETTCVAYIVNTLPRIPGQPCIQNKFVISAGWDKRLYVWMDSGDTSVKMQGYSLRMPSDEEACVTGHTQDITCLQFVPPYHVASGGKDGLVCFWNLNSGHQVTSFNLRTGVESMILLERVRLLACARQDGKVSFINTRNSIIHDTVSMKMTPGEAVVSLCTDTTNDYFFTGDNAGCIKVWDVLDPRYNYAFLEECTHWKAHAKRITSIDYVENNRILDTFLLTACADGTVGCWTLNGAHVGQFGQRNVWNLDDNDTFRAPSPEPPEHDVEDGDDEGFGDDSSDSDVEEDIRVEYAMDDDDDFLELASRIEAHDQGGSKPFSMRLTMVGAAAQSGIAPKPPVLLPPGPPLVSANAPKRNSGTSGRRLSKRRSMAAMKRSAREDAVKRSKGFVSDVLPQTSDVWFRYEESQMHNTRRTLSAITITKIDELNNEVTGWDGLCHPSSIKGSMPNVIKVALSEFQDRLRWHKNDDMSERIGRIFCDSDRVPYKVLYAYRSECNHQWLLIDTLLRAHPPVEAVGGKRAPRSMSIFKRRASQEKQNLQLLPGINEIGANPSHLRTALYSMDEVSGSSDEEADSPRGSDEESAYSDAADIFEDEYDHVEEVAECEEDVSNVKEEEVTTTASPQPRAPRQRRRSSVRRRQPNEMHHAQRRKTGQCHSNLSVHSIRDVPSEFGQLRTTLSRSAY